MRLDYSFSSRKIVTTIYDLRIEGTIVGSDGINKVFIKLKKDFGLHKKGDIISENIKSCVYKSTLKTGKRTGRHYGSLCCFGDIPIFKP